ncbi:hypothetical protein JXA40_11770 [bacterium]|nr:hypothetical protein [candidate division CSSED10-310 bacterium]
MNGMTIRVFSWMFTFLLTGLIAWAIPRSSAQDTPVRVRCLYNGYILTVDPDLALSDSATDDRYRLYVLHALLVDPNTGRIAAIYPSLPGNPGTTGQIALPLSSYPDLLTLETPPSPGVTAHQVIDYWRSEGVDESLLAGLSPIDLNGSVVTPGLLDDHFHVTSFSKKMPAPGETFGFIADVSDPSYYTDTETWEQVCIRETLWEIVADANRHIADKGKSTMYLHGYWLTEIDDPQGSAVFPDTFMYAEGTGDQTSLANDVYILNRIGRGEGVPMEPPDDPCNSDPSEWPPCNYETLPAVMVHTSGQVCFYTPGVLERFNDFQINIMGCQFDPVEVLQVTAPGPDETEWTITVNPASPGATQLLALTPPFNVDAAADTGSPVQTLYVPFVVIESDPENGSVYARPFFEDLAEDVFSEPFDTAILKPFYRPIPEVISRESWNAAAEYAGHSPSEELTDYGDWNPAEPYSTNWYNGSERGLLQYFHDDVDDVWRPSGYAEHYVMRDALSSFVLDTPTVGDCVEQRRRLARWCHRHGITGVNDIMFYRRTTNEYEFSSYEELSYDHGTSGTEYSDRGPYNLRTGLYYYLENAGEVGQIKALAHDPDGGYDMQRLVPPVGHPEYPGWVRWQGWKMQLDGGTGARTIFSSAPVAKIQRTDEYPTVDENGNAVLFMDHGFGLLTMTNEHEQVFTSRETAALYWIVRESDPTLPEFYNPDIQHNWSFLKNGVLSLLYRDIDPDALAGDLAELDHVELIVSEDPPVNQPADLADKITRLVDQIDDGFERTLSAMAKIWYEVSLEVSQGVPIPHQVACHCLGDGAVDLYVYMIKTLKYDVEYLPDNWDDLPSYWQSVIPEDADLGVIKRMFEGERYRVEHLLNYSCIATANIKGNNGIDRDTSPDARNVVFSTQPSLLALDGKVFGTKIFPYAQELWEIPNDLAANYWRGVPWRPRSHHHMPCPLYTDWDIPFTLNTDPPSVRDPRPALTVVAAVARTPLEIDPTHWVGQIGTDPVNRPPDYLTGKVYSPFGLTTETPTNPMRLSIEQALCAMTFWAAYVCEAEREQGAVAVPVSGTGAPGWYADLVVWQFNPLGIRSPGGMSLEQLGRTPEGVQESERLGVVNAFISKFLPEMTLVGAVPVWRKGVRIDMPLTAHPGESFFVTGYLDNPEPPMMNTPVFFLLDVYGEYWFWPGWTYFHPPESEAIDYDLMDLATGTTAVDVIEEFIWPDTGSQSVNGLYFYGAMLNSTMTDLDGEMAIVEWGYGP